MEKTIYVCKMCGRAIKAFEKPNFCYYDRMDHMENISPEDAVKMGLFCSRPEYAQATVDGVGNNRVSVIFEFLGDVHWSPFTGEELIGHSNKYPDAKMEGMQVEIMRRVVQGD